MVKQNKQYHQRRVVTAECKQKCSAQSKTSKAKHISHNNKISAKYETV